MSNLLGQKSEGAFKARSFTQVVFEKYENIDGSITGKYQPTEKSHLANLYEDHDCNVIAMDGKALT
jgi:hypothetical protein